MRYVVWSNEHRMWWRAAERGYTESLDEAGRYSREDAERIVASATCDGQLTYRRTDPYTGEEYSQLAEVLLLAPEDTPPEPAERVETGRVEWAQNTADVATVTPDASFIAVPRIT